jgi:hypothetical protein
MSTIVWLIQENLQRQCPWLYVKKINAQSQQRGTQIVQLNRSSVKFLGKIPNVFMRLASNIKVTQTIDIYVVDIPNVHSLLLTETGP